MKSPPLRTRSRAGFTLVELLIVVLIIGALLAIALPLYRNTIKQSFGNVAKSNLRSMFSAAQLYRARTGGYPADETAIFAELNGSLDEKPAGVTYTFGKDGGNYVLTATESGDVFGTGAAGETITFTFAPDAATGVFAP